MHRLTRGLLLVGMGIALISAQSFAGGNKAAQEPGTKAQPGQKDPPKKDTKDEPKEIVIKGEITKTDPFDAIRDQSHHKVHVVKMIPDFTYTIHMKAKADKKPQFDTYLRLEDSSGNQQAENDDYINTDSRIVFTPKKADDFRIIATTFDPGLTGSYTLTISPLKAGSLPAVPGLVFKVDGELTKNDPIDTQRAGAHHKVHMFKMVPGKTYIIDMQSTFFDTWLRLEDAQGNQLAFDDDSGGGLNSQIVFTAKKADTYRIIATTFGSGTTGKYTITIKAK